MRAALMLMYWRFFTTKVLYIAGLDQPVTGASSESHVGAGIQGEVFKGPLFILSVWGRPVHLSTLIRV